MKTFLFTITLIICTLNLFNTYGQGVAVNTSGTTADPSAMLDINSANLGVLIPRIGLADTTDAVTITSPATSLVIFNTSTGGGLVEGYYYNSGTPASPRWTQFFPNPANGNLDMHGNKITGLATCTDDGDAANKAYVDAVAGGGGGGGGLTIPTMISNESASDYIHSDAIQYCDNLNESGFTDWRLPSFDEIVFFEGMAGATTELLWTRTPSQLIDHPTNQNFVTMRLSDGRWTDGGINEFFFPERSVSESVPYNTSWVVADTFRPLTPGNLFVPTSFRFYASCSCGHGGNFRLRYFLPDGTDFYSAIYYVDCSSTNLINYATIAPLSSKAAYSEIQVEVQSVGSSTNNRYAALYIAGYEITLGQKAGTTKKCRCVR